MASGGALPNVPVHRAPTTIATELCIACRSVPSSHVERCLLIIATVGVVVLTVTLVDVCWTTVGLRGGGSYTDSLRKSIREFAAVARAEFISARPEEPTGPGLRRIQSVGIPVVPLESSARRCDVKQKLDGASSATTRERDATYGQRTSPGSSCYRLRRIAL